MRWTTISGEAMICPLCGLENDYDWPITVNGEIKDGGCQECWEAECAREWWKMIEVLQPLMGAGK
jgi:hypothetical protein